MCLNFEWKSTGTITGTNYYVIVQQIKGIFIKSFIIHEENPKETTAEAEVLNRQEICVDLHKL